MPRGTKHCNGCSAFTSRLVAFRRPSSSGKLIMHAGVGAIDNMRVWGRGTGTSPLGQSTATSTLQRGTATCCGLGLQRGTATCLSPALPCRRVPTLTMPMPPPACHFERSNRAPPALLSLEMGVPCSSSSWKGRRRSRGALLVAHAPSDKGLSAYQALTWGSLAPYRDPGATHGRGARAWTGAQQPGSGRWAGTATTACPRTNAFEPNRLRPQAQ